MARDALPIVDVDSHYAENIAGLWHYMKEPWRTRMRDEPLARYLPSSLGDRNMGPRIKRPDHRSDVAGVDPAEVRDYIVKSMKQLGISATILVPNKLVLLGHLSSRGLAVAMMNANIDYQLDAVVDPKLGIYTAVVVSWHEPEEAAATIERVADNPGVVGVCVTTSHAMPAWGDTRYNPIFEAAQRHSLPIVVHGDAGLTLTERAAVADGMQSLIEAHSLGFLVGNEVHLTSMVFQGVAVRFPRLKIVFLESGVFYVPMMMYRLDQYFLKRRAEAPLLQALPSEYMKEYFYWGSQPLEAPKEQEYTKAIFSMIDAPNHVLYASDYPHWDYDDPVVINRLAFLPERDKAAILAGNALSVFRFGQGGGEGWQLTVSERLARYRTAAVR